MGAALTYQPLGTDSITVACYDVRFWQQTLRRLGFETIAPPPGRGVAQDGMVALAHGDLNVLLIDPTHRDYGPDVAQFLALHGDMQVFRASVLVQDAARARQELATVTTCSPLETVEDPLGPARRFRLVLPQEGVLTWELVERTGPRHVLATDSWWKTRGVDHYAIGVTDLAPWERLYHSLGFETIYVPREEIAGEHSAMKTVAVQRGRWVVALVAGVDRTQPSQVTTYVKTHGNHAVQHAAVLFDDLRATLKELLARGVQFRLRRVRRDSTVPLAIDDIMHEGKDHSGPLLQCFTKPLARRPDPQNPAVYQAGFFFELIQRVASPQRAGEKEQAFHDPTVIGLYRAIEYEELEKDSGLIFADMRGRGFSAWLQGHQGRQRTA